MEFSSGGVQGYPQELKKDTGQKQRVALARAVYHRQCSLVLLDDVFSALDAHTSRHILCLDGVFTAWWGAESVRKLLGAIGAN